VYAPWPSLALQVWGCGGWNKLREKVQLGTQQLGGLLRYPVLHRPASSCGRSVAQLSEGGCVSLLRSVTVGLTQDADASQPSPSMLINSLELRAAGFTLSQVIPPALEAAARGGSAPTSGYGS